MTKKNFFSLIDILGIFLVTFIVYKTLLPCGKVCTFYGDDLISPFYTFGVSLPLSNPFSAFLTNSHTSWVFSLFHVLTVRILPITFGIHPQIFAQTVFFPFACFIFTIYLYSVANNFNKYSKTKHLTFILVLILFPLTISILRKCDFFWIFTQCCWFYAYVFMLLFGIVAFCELQAIYVNKEHFSKKRLITLLVLIFLLGGCYEFYKFIICSTVVLGLCFDKIFTKDSICNKKSIAFLIYTLFCNTFLFLIPFSIIHNNSYVKLFSFNEFINFIPSYFQEYLHYVICDNAIFYVLIVGLLLLINAFGEDKLKNKRFFIYTFSTLLSVFLYNFVIIIGSNISYYSSVLAHSGVRFCNSTVLLCLFLSCLSYFISNTECKKPVLIGLIIASILYGTYVNKETFKYEEYIIPYGNIRQCHYVLEKFFVINSLNKPVFYNYYGAKSLFNNYIISYYTYIYQTSLPFSAYKPICITDDKYSQPNKNHYEAIRDLMIQKCKEVTGYQITKEEYEKMDFQSLYKFRGNNL